MPENVLISLESIGDDCSLELTDATEILSEKENRKANSFRFDKHRNRYTRGRGLLRTKLGALLSIDPSKVVIEEEERGKPFVNGEKLSFNLSHTSDIAIYAFSTELTRIGVDIELTDRQADITGLSRHYFSELEFNLIESLEGEPQREAFFRIWTAKEARMKLTGEGLYLDPRDIEIKLDQASPVGFHRPLPGNQTIKTLKYDNPGAIASIVADRHFEIRPFAVSRK